jgi:hypothetical protein
MFHEKNTKRPHTRICDELTSNCLSLFLSKLVLHKIIIEIHSRKDILQHLTNKHKIYFSYNYKIYTSLGKEIINCKNKNEIIYNLKYLKEMVIMCFKISRKLNMFPKECYALCAIQKSVTNLNKLCYALKCKNAQKITYFNGIRKAWFLFLTDIKNNSIISTYNFQDNPQLVVGKKK